MRSTRRLLLALAGALAAGPVAAQSAGTVELGAFGKWTKFGNPLATDVINHLPRDNGFGFGGRLGIFVVRRLEIEADASYTKVDAAVTAGSGKVSYLPIHIGPTYNFRLGEHAAFLLGARYVHNKYGDAADFSDHGFGGLVGFRFGPVRIDGTGDWMSSDGPGHGNYHNLGVDAGLSLLLGGKHCHKADDGVTVAPNSATLERSQRVTFTGTALHCGKPREVTWTATGGSITQGGEYTAGQTPGSYLVTATEPKSGLSGTATVMIKEPPPPPPPPLPPPPPPPPITVSRIDLRPDHARAKVHESVAFTVTALMSDGSSRPLDNCPLTATGNATQSGNSFSWGRYGNYTVTANCEGQTDQSAVEVPLEIVIYGANFAFNKDQLTAAGMDSVRAAADSLKNYPEIKVRLGGFADFVGTDAYNCNLTGRRAQTVHRALNQFGISDDRISVIEGFGHAYPIPDDQVPQAWKDINTRTHDKGKWWDRRVDITSASKDPGMTACAEPASPVRKKP
jgi:outer membrane protein OmpA-like peptidoglycan-associated protein